MEQIHKILVAVDFSEHSERALDQAIELAKAFGAELHLLHCYPLHVTAIDPYGTPVPETYVRELREAAGNRLSQWCSKARAQDLVAEQHLSEQSPFTEIAALAEKLGADLIVMGTRGLSGLKHVLLGSVTERTIRIAPCPVWTVKHAATD
jgi:nucleotide-binding universal stress UspA family protein